MNSGDFVHLHCHSDYSHLDGAAKTESLVKAAKKAGHTALALTDHGSVSGAIEFWKACNAEGIKPIIGIEAYLAPGLDELAHTRRGKDEDGKDRRDPVTGRMMSFDYSHFTLLAKNFTGLKNIYRLASEAAINGFYYRPRMSWALIKERHEGIIALSGCLSGEPAEELKKGNDALALQHARRWRGLFGDDYYMELMPAWAPEQAKVNDGCLKIAKDLGAKCVATTDVHYVNPGDADVQEVKICVANHKTLAENRETGLNMKPVFFYKSTDEVAKDFTGYEHVLLTSREIADKVEKIEGKDIVPGKHKQYFMPKFVPPDGSKPLDFFKRIAQAGLIERYGLEGAKLNQARLNFELEVIEKSGFVEYLLIVWDFINWARNNGVPVGPGRGSVAGSLASYCMKITNIDPIRYDLLFERFMNPARVSMPDIDTDFDDRGRGRVVEYVKQKYGEECVSQIITFGENKAKSSIRDVARTIGVDVETTNRIARMIPDGPGIELADCLRDIDELKKAGEEDLRIGRVLNLALQLEGFYRNPGRHAAALVIGDKDLRERIPLTVVGSKHNRGVCTAFSMEYVEDVGLVKMDLLGLRTLTQIYDTLDLIQLTTGKRLEEDHIPVRDDKNMGETVGGHVCWVHDRPFSECQCCDKTLRILCEAETNGVFQVGSPGMKKLLKQMKPDRFDDIIALVALFRPGPLGTGMDQTYIRRKNGEEPITYDHPKLEPILKNTMGQFIYQESLMQLSVVLAGFTMPQADELRKATAKKKPEDMAKIGPNFVKGCIEVSGLTEEKAKSLWEQIVFFSSYSFNKSHSAAYGLISWHTAWLKANYPIEFFAGLMTSECGSTDALATYIDEAMRWSIEILPPDINTSSVRFSVVRMPEGSMAISYGLEAVKGVSTEAASAIVEARKKVGRFRSALHFFESVDTDVVGTAAVEALAQAGAFLSTGANRAQLLTPQKYYKGKKVVKEIEETPLKAASLMARRSKKEARTGQGMLFDVPDPQEEAEMLVGTDLMPDIPEWPRRKIAEAEKESMGFYLTTHPLQEYMDVLQEYVSVISKKVRDMRPHARDHVVMGGLVVGMRTIIDKKGNEMAFVSVEDLSGPVDGRIFARTWVEVRRKISIGAVIFMAGELDDESDPPAMRVDRVWTPDEVPKELPRGRSLFMQLGKGSVTEVLKTAILDVLKRNPGDMPVFWAYRGEQELRRCMDQRTSGTHQVRQELRNVLGGRGEVAYE